MNSSHANISEELLARYLADTASESERNDVEAWLAESEANARELATYRLIWDHTAAMKKSSTGVDTDAAWNKMKGKMAMGKTADPLSKLPGKEVPTPEAPTREARTIEFRPEVRKRRLPVTVWAAAVIAILVTAFGWFFLISEKTPESLQVATTDNTKEQLLPDGTKVFLNYNSKLTYPENFKGDLRTVSLQGEAFFDVKRDAAHPFVIQANGTEIRVLGTSFNVKAYDAAPVRVDVATGKVRVSKDSHRVELVKGQSAEVLKDSIRSLQANINLMGYRTQIYEFNAADLQDVVTSIRDGYHVDVRLSNDKIAQCRLTIRFEKEPVDATLSVIAETLDLNLRKEGKVYWLDGNGCQ
ncbi:ferric-dicitrate binding protein FerR (iron transport regulator) [Dyadobacter sp. BE34]|uniref:Ferric-dicitrate binding protein FerR (Iron transport regulator) n=1 Tax=Dyadobacter fermentans TaxID=94254 RepID=A0ABU1R334_9BACT|nr:MULTISPECIES: FecR domain-containing protein [Dyadobacter]MDR6806980.1 ferric-dicitrate binding protein FerR (iron transport regulator) [Dyadobacter fermentans]MDR7044721.1 ferric-dicitrate binding protein FerR (iron transport regulator) [Dyadobacter sp. BE242]MDR7199543.1 ferric-dicitrate binding protein FerR (iron transport regulator) [Dyadobacter sp. BE34]MDR7217503.1 ferric-dicitrate binding protein FerR (iron transport regulator) [Dyadobacter sp. BE31]MDR7265434.1 ferric-dicitrate bind